ncbi:ChrR family anti-sigma-E factor [Aeromonas veronii]|uniref:ChrR family anti-sigma-E factor n=1 Tax=Aeromonas veronii TaxID=654 RepID=UPI0032EBDBBE
MIKAHPTPALLRAYAADELPLPLTVGVAAHCELCAECGADVNVWEAELAASHLEEAAPAPALDAVLAAILQQPAAHQEVQARPATELRVGDRGYPLPRALARYHQASWRRIGGIRHCRLPLAEQGIRASLLHVATGGQIPDHTHQGYELTLLLAGSLQEGEVRYQAGDFIWRDARHHHSPHTPDGCLCYIVQDAPIRFTKGLPRLLNRISHRLY